MAEMTKPVAFNAHPVDLIIAMLGDEKVTLGGFGAEAMPYSWVRPELRFVSADETPAAAIQFVEQRQRSMTIIRVVTLIVLLIAGISFGVWFGSSQNAPEPMAQTLIPVPVLWTVTSVEMSGVTIRLENNKALAEVKLGSKLPNGEVLVSTIPQSQVYVTDKATTMINPPTQQPSKGQ